MLTLYAIPVSLYCAKLRIVLRHKELEWQEVPPAGGYGSDAYKTIVASGNLPALRDGDLLLADSEAIAEYLNERYPHPPMLPGDLADRAKIRELSRFHDTRLEPEVRALFAHMPGRETPPEGFVASQSAAISARLGHLAQLLGTMPETDAPTLADCGFPITFAWLDLLTPTMGLEITWPAAIANYRARLEANPTIAAELAEYVPRLTTFLDG